MLEATIKFLLITVALEVTPGPAVLFVLYQSAFGMRYVLLGVAGLVTSNLIWLTLIATGLALILTNSPMLFGAMRYAGAAYLLYLGYKIARYGIGKPQAADTSVRKSKLKTYQQGMITSLSNPKALIFFMALFPQFTRTDFFTQDIIYFGALKITLLIVVMTSYGLMGKKMFNRLGRSKWANTVSRVLGGAIAFAAIGLAIG